MYLFTKFLFITLGSQLKILHQLHCTTVEKGSACGWSGGRGKQSASRGGCSEGWRAIKMCLASRD